MGIKWRLIGNGCFTNTWRPLPDMGRVTQSLLPWCYGSKHVKKINGVIHTNVFLFIQFWEKMVQNIAIKPECCGFDQRPC